jgi:hypothetical protein
MHYAGMLPGISPQLPADRGVVNMGYSASIHR